MRGSRICRPTVVAAVALAGCASLALAQSTGVEVGKISLNKNGNGRLPVTVPGPGTILVRDIRSLPPVLGCGPSRRMKPVTAFAQAAGVQTVRLPIKARGPARRKIRDGRTAKVVARIQFTPDTGTAVTQSVKLKLHKPGKGGGSGRMAHAACSPPPPSY